jgi:hypothetical protein
VLDLRGLPEPWAAAAVAVEAWAAGATPGM